MALQDELDGVRAVVTGGTQGIGAAVVRRLAASGARVVAVARRSAPVPDGVHLVAADLSTAEGAAAAAEQALDVLGGLDVLVDNAGANTRAPDGPLTATDDLWAGNLDVNLLSAVRLDRALAPVLVAQGHGSIVHVSSGAAVWPQPDAVPYAAAKAALNAYSKGLATALGPSGVRVTAVMPGAIATEAFERGVEKAAAASGLTLDAVREQARARFNPPLNRLGRPEEVADLIAFLVSPRGSYLSGTRIAVDGGLLPTV